jgi:hypothetical protein
LRSEHTISSHIAYLEAKAYGATFSTSSSIIRRGYDLEEAALSKWKKGADQNMNEQVARKKWRPVFEKQEEDIGRWTQGEEYVHKAKQGEIPTYKAGSLDSFVSVLANTLKAPPPKQGPDLLNANESRGSQTPSS